jgi:hypothetical protein
VPTDCDVSGGFIAPDWTEDTGTARSAALLRRDFTLTAEVSTARLHVASSGLYETGINGIRVGDHVLASGRTSHDHRLRYRTFDVTRLLQPGANTIGAWLGDGRRRGARDPDGGAPDRNREPLGLWAQLEVTYADGGTDTIITDERWRAHRAPITSSDLHGGETYHARVEIRDWSRPGLDDRGWSGVRVLDTPPGRLVASTGPPTAESVAAWLHRAVAGLSPAEPGYRKLRIAPTPVSGLISASAAHETPYGRAEVAWERNGVDLTVRVTVPPNTTAIVELPDQHDPFEIGSGEHTFLSTCQAVEDEVRIDRGTRQ